MDAPLLPLGNAAEEPRPAIRVTKVAALNVILWLCTLLPLSLVSMPLPDPYAPVEWAKNRSAQVNWTVPMPRPYPDTTTVRKREAATRERYFFSEASIMVAVCVSVTAGVAALRPRRAPRTEEEITMLLRPWVIACETIDGVAVACFAATHGAFLHFGIYWEDWMQLYALLLTSIISQCALGAVPADNAGLMAFPLTSGRFVRIKDKVQMAALMSKGFGGAILALLSLGIVLVAHYLMLRHFPVDYAPSFFAMSMERARRPLYQGTWREWALEKIEVMTRDGKVAYAAVHDFGQTVIVVVMLIAWGGSPFGYFSLLLTGTRVLCLPLGRVLVLQWLDEWGPLYLLLARLYGWAAQAAGAARCPKAVGARAMNRVTENFILAGVNRKAVDNGREALRLSRDALGERHPVALDAARFLANALHATGERQEALGMRREVLRLRQEIQGERHPDTLNVAIFLQEVREAQESMQ